MIKGNNYKIIYPQNFTYLANSTTQYINWLSGNPNYYDITPKRIPIVLHSDGGISNGMVTWAPRVTNLYMLPPQNTRDYWLKTLTIHEYRHMLQMEKVNQHATKALYYIFGDIAPIVAIGTYIPQWFLEGDAVLFETALTNIGRGRDPEFLNELKAQILEKQLYSYDKAVLGSYKDYVPNHYSLGYYITAYSRILYNNEIWNNALERVSKRPYAITPFTASIRKTTGLKQTRKNLYKSVFNHIIEEWANDSSHQYSNLNEVYTNNKYYTNYYSPIIIGQDSVIAYKNGIAESGAIVLLHNNKEKILTRTGVLYDKKIAWNNGTIIWSEYKPHPRFSHSGKQQLCSYNTHTGKYQKHNSENNRYAPFSTNTGWGCVEILPSGESQILILDNNFNTCKQIECNPNELFVHPSFYNNKIYTIVNSADGNRIECIDTETDDRNSLLSKQHYIIDNPICYNDTIYFNASFNTNNAIYRIANNATQHIAESKYGVIAPSIWHSQLTASSYTADGYKPILLNINNVTPQQIEFRTFKTADTITALENFNHYSHSNTANNQTVKRYKRFPHLLNIHSWGPVYLNSQQMDIKLGATVYTQNTLNTFAATTGYVWKEGYKYGAYQISAEYRGLWPIISINGEFGKREITAKDNFYFYKFTPRYNRLSCTIRLPLNFTNRSGRFSVLPYLSYNLEGYSSDITQTNIPLLPETVKFEKRNAQFIDYGINASFTKVLNSQEILPKYGASLHIGQAKEINNFGIGDLLYGDITLYAPGIFRNHGITLYAGKQSASNKQTIFYAANILLPRGVKLQGSDYNTIRTSYTLPICYPDLGIGSMIYFKRIYGSLFYDYGTIRNGDINNRVSSYGAEIKTDFNLLRLTYPLNMGVRAGYETLSKRVFAELLFTISISI